MVRRIGVQPVSLALWGYRAGCYTAGVCVGVYVYACPQAVALAHDVEIAAGRVGSDGTVYDPPYSTASARCRLLQQPFGRLHRIDIQKVPIFSAGHLALSDFGLP